MKEKKISNQAIRLAGNKSSKQACWQTRNLARKQASKLVNKQASSLRKSYEMNCVVCMTPIEEG